ncbi:MAG: hypothetical protein ACYSW8_29690, partial [Planctomycetota bacterium]
MARDFEFRFDPSERPRAGGYDPSVFRPLDPSEFAGASMLDNPVRTQPVRFDPGIRPPGPPGGGGAFQAPAGAGRSI